VGKPRTNRYSASKGIPGLRRAQAAYYARRFGVKLNPETQVVATLGSKEGFANMAQAISAPGRRHLVSKSNLSDPRIRLHHLRRRHPSHSRLGAARRRGVFARRRTRREALDPASPCRSC
jgi:histidinol-phosphate/aromatic aminotransferase/cobyric acid decarboxylase-like protein